MGHGTPCLTSLFLFDCYLDYWPKVFSGAKLILVSRNPLDQMGSVLIDGKHLLEAPNWSVRFLYGRDAYTNRSLEFFMETTLQRYKYISETYDRLGDQNMLVVQFENLVNSYQKTKGEIETFLGLDPADHASPLSNFRPDESREGLISRGGLCDRTKAKAQEMEKQYQNMIDHTKAI